MDSAAISRAGGYDLNASLSLVDRKDRETASGKTADNRQGNKGDSVSISEAARELLQAAESTATRSQKPEAVMTALTDFGTTVTVEAHALERTTFTMGGQLARKSAFSMAGASAENPVEMAFSVTFARTNGQVQTFELGGNAVFREMEDGTILMDSRQGAGSSRLEGTDGNEIFIAIEDDTEVVTGNGNNRVFNLARNSRILGGEGDDLIASLADGAHIEGGAGDDAIILLNDTLRPTTSASLDESMADDPENRRENHRTRGAQTVEVDAGDGNNLLASGVDLFKGFIRSGDGEDTVRLHDATSTRINTGGGNDSFSGRDLFYTNLDGGAGDDSLSVHNMRGGGISGGTGNDVITVNELVDAFAGGDEGDDTIMISSVRSSAIGGGAGNDNIIVDRLVNSLVDGGTGDDFISVGSSFNSRIEGGGGNDVIRTGQVDSYQMQQNGNVATFMAARSATSADPDGMSNPIVAVGPGNTRRVVSE